MRKGSQILKILTVTLLLAAFSEARKEIVLSTNPSYVLNYEVLEDRIRFDAVVSTLGYVGFGISLFPNTTGSDLVLGGVYSNGTVYHKEFHGHGKRHHSSHHADDHQDHWTVGLISENKNAGTTSVSFTRLLDTGDSKHVQIKDEELYVLWAVGRTDEFRKHYAHGSFQLNLLSP